MKKKIISGIKTISSFLYSTKKNENIKIFNDDVFLVSYPKSGNTWVRHLIGNYLSKGEMDFVNGATLMPDIHFNPQDIANIGFRPRFIKSHFPYRPEYKKVIYIVRDGRDACVSYFYFLKKMQQIELEVTFSDYFENYFNTGKSAFGKWNDHVFSWLHEKKSNVLLVKYEDLLSDTYREMQRMLTFAGLEIDSDRIKVAIEKSSFKEMQNDEKKNADYLSSMGHKTGHVDYGIVREGKSGVWEKEFSEEEINKFWELNGDAMNFLGYTH